MNEHRNEESHQDVIKSAVIEALAYLGSPQSYFILDMTLNGETIPVREAATR
ncbi:hypothetical protein [Metallosphaera sp.]|uniref:hypothetical protein n=1 Tax=Metallosphaera sp. TaxID=2020860 RepID=UPI0031672562